MATLQNFVVHATDTNNDLKNDILYPRQTDCKLKGFSFSEQVLFFIAVVTVSTKDPKANALKHKFYETKSKL